MATVPTVLSLPLAYDSDSQFYFESAKVHDAATL